MTLSRKIFHWCLVSLTVFVYTTICQATEINVALEQHDSYLRPARSFSAVLVEYNKHNEQTKHKTKLTLSEYGMRSEALNAEDSVQHMVFIQDYDSSRRWLVNTTRACYSELPEDKGTDEKASSDKHSTSTPSILSIRPCNNSKAEKLSAREINNTELSVWKCTDQQGLTYIQHFSTLLGLVVRQESQEGQIGELVNISLNSPEPQYFKPSDKWREVTLEEFITGRAVLPSYED